MSSSIKSKNLFFNIKSFLKPSEDVKNSLILSIFSKLEKYYFHLYLFFLN